MANATNNVIAFPRVKKTATCSINRASARVLDINGLCPSIDPVERAERELFASFIQAGKSVRYARTVIEYLRLPSDNSGSERVRKGVTLPQFLTELNCGRA
jgi:hypothetical protein